MSVNALQRGIDRRDATPRRRRTDRFPVRIQERTAAIEALAEALTLAEKNEVDRTKLACMLGQTLFACPAYQTYGAAIVQERYKPAGFLMSLGLKDINLVLQTAAASAMPMPFASLLHDRLLAMVAQGRSDLDWTAVALGVAAEAGLSREKDG